MADTEKLVTLERLQALLDAYGSAPERWPEEERAAATALIDSSSEARALVEEVAALDALLAKVLEPEVSAALISRLKSMDPPAKPGLADSAVEDGLLSRMTAWLRPKSRFAWQGAVATAAVLGMVAGVGLSTLLHERVAQTPVVTADTTVQPVVPPDPVFNSGPDPDGTPTLTALSLTGEALAEGGAENDDNETDGIRSDAGEINVAGIPLY